MDVSRAIKANTVFLIIQLIAVICDIVIAFFTETGTYFILMIIIGIAYVLYNGIVQSRFMQRVAYNQYNDVLQRLPYVFTDIRVYRAAKRRGDKETVKVLRQGNISSALMILNVAAILAITFVLHPESIG
jgi:uncharacterized membrane protein (DUF106 family)